MGGVIHPLHQVDLLTPAERKITEKEYWAQRRGQEKLDELNQKMKEDGITPKETRYQTEKQFLRDAIDDAASTAQSPEEFSKILDEKYHIIFKISRNRYSYLHPGRKKYITERNLGTRYTEDFLLKAFEENTKSHREQKEEILEQQGVSCPEAYMVKNLGLSYFCYPCTIHFHKIRSPACHRSANLY